MLASSVLQLGAARVTLEDVTQVARGKRKVAFDPAALERLRQARAVVDRIATAGTPVYGVTTGLGAAVDTKLDPTCLTQFQRNAISARAVGIGFGTNAFTPDQARAIIFARMAGLAQGGSGISPDWAQYLAACLNADLSFEIPTIGSIGGADLAPLADLAGALLGEGEAGAQLRQAGLEAPPLRPKDGLALFNANAATVGVAALALQQAEDLLAQWLGVIALSLEAYRANLTPLDPRAVAARPQPGQDRIAAYLLGLLKGGDLLQPGAARKVQDPLSFRCAAPVFAALLTALEEACAAVEIELNTAADNPLVLAVEDVSFSTANFDVTHLALRMENLRVAIALAAQTGFARLCKLMSPQSSELPRFLAPEGGQRNGFATSQKTAAALDARIRHAAQPTSLGVSWVADGVEDYAPNTLQAALKLTEQLGDVASLIALEAMVAAEAVELRKIPHLGQGSARILTWLRERVPALTQDRALGREIDATGQALLAGQMLAALDGKRP